MGMRHYKVRLTTTGLVHIGNGNTLNKKDYFLHNGKIAVLDPVRFTSQLNAEQMGAYCSFLETGSSEGLEDFLKKRGLHPLADKCIAYRLDAKLNTTRRGTYSYYEVAEFVKDAYGFPYVPGSSLKGTLRTALMAAIVAQDAAVFKQAYPSGSDWRRKKNADASLDKQVFWREHLDPDDPKAATDIMRFVSVSDSEPLSTASLVFASKYDKFSRGDIRDGNDLNICRECLRPGTEVVFQIDVDERVDGHLPFALDSEGMLRAFRDFDVRYEECFVSHFDLGGVEGCGGEGKGSGTDNAGDGQCQYILQAGPLAGMRCRNHAVDGTGYCNTHQDKAAAMTSSESSSCGEVVACYLGGGVDFDSKTVLNVLFKDDNERLNEIPRILFAQFPTKIDERFGHGKHRGLANAVRAEGFEPCSMKAWIKRDGRVQKAKDDHRHWMDFDLGVSPHTLKLGKVGSKLYPMGKCSVQIEELPTHVARPKGATQ